MTEDMVTNRMLMMACIDQFLAAAKKSEDLPYGINDAALCAAGAFLNRVEIIEFAVSKGADKENDFCEYTP